MVVVKAGFEPLLFTAHFQGWDYAQKGAFEDLYEMRRKEKEAEEAKKREEDEKIAKQKSQRRASQIEEMEKKIDEKRRASQTGSSVGELETAEATAGETDSTQLSGSEREKVATTAKKSVQKGRVLSPWRKFNFSHSTRYEPLSRDEDD